VEFGSPVEMQSVNEILATLIPLVKSDRARKENRENEILTELARLVNEIERPRVLQDDSPVSLLGECIRRPRMAALSHHVGGVQAAPSGTYPVEASGEEELKGGSFVPVVSVTLRGNPTKALVDTGADYCIITRSWLERSYTPTEIDRMVEHPKNASVFVLGDGRASTALGLVALQIQLGRHQLRSHCFLFESAPYDLILGAEFLLRHRLDVSLAEQCLVFNGKHKTPRQTIPFVGQGRSIPRRKSVNVVLRAEADFNLEPGKEKLVWARIPASERAALGEAWGAVARDPGQLKVDAITANGVTELAAGRTKVLVGNFSGT
jgi:hypothetical protein